MATKTTTRTTAALILATFALMTAGVIPAAFAQDPNQDVAHEVDPESGDVQIAEAKPDLSENNRQGNLISLFEELVSSQAIGGSNGGEAMSGSGSSTDSDSSQGQTVDHPAQGNGANFGEDLGISNAFNVGSVEVDLHDLIDLTPPADAV